MGVTQPLLYDNRLQQTPMILDEAGIINGWIEIIIGWNFRMVDPV